MVGAGAGLVITLAPIGPDARRRGDPAAGRPDAGPSDRPRPGRRPRAGRHGSGPAADSRRGIRRRSGAALRPPPRCADSLAMQLRTGQPLPIGAQAKHGGPHRVLRELHHPAAPNGRLRLLFATESAETRPFAFSPLAARPPGQGRR
ncbi:hypothetical protein ACRAWF_25720 [Streptomyces sp. L7]